MLQAHPGVPLLGESADGTRSVPATYAWTGNISNQPVHGFDARALAHGHVACDRANFRGPASAAACARVVGSGHVAAGDPGLLAKFDAARRQHCRVWAPGCELI